jgi:hypothetical protein
VAGDAGASTSVMKMRSALAVFTSPPSPAMVALTCPATCTWCSASLPFTRADPVQATSMCRGGAPASSAATTACSVPGPSAWASSPPASTTIFSLASTVPVASATVAGLPASPTSGRPSAPRRTTSVLPVATSPLSDTARTLVFAVSC